MPTMMYASADDTRQRVEEVPAADHVDEDVQTDNDDSLPQQAIHNWQQDPNVTVYDE